jgi:aspartate racemase
VKANRVADVYAPLAKIVRSLGVRGASSVVLGCTEIPLGVWAGPGPDLPVVDTIDALARAATARAEESKGKSPPLLLTLSTALSPSRNEG